MAGKKETLDLLEKTPLRGGWWKWLLGFAVVAAVSGFLLWLAFREPAKTTMSGDPSISSESAALIQSHNPSDSTDDSEKPIAVENAIESSDAEPIQQKVKPNPTTEIEVSKPVEVVYFATGSSAIIPAEMAKLKTFAGLLKKTGKLLIEGHADAIGTEEFNEMLSKQRADQVLSYLQSAGLGDGWKIDLKFYGEKKPTSNNDTVEGRAKNRRVELVTR